MQGQFSEECCPDLQLAHRALLHLGFASFSLKEFSLWDKGLGILLLSDADVGVLSPQGRERGERMLKFYAVFHQLIKLSRKTFSGRKSARALPGLVDQ